MKHLLNVSIFCFFILNVCGQVPKSMHSGEIHMAIKKLNFLGSVLYIAAHPDDENTWLISYMANKEKAHTTYLSLTRGDGGQNLIGTEIAELLGVIRTQELLAARGVDGGNQHFSRAIDFGYSKHPNETLEVWDKDKILSDVIWTIRKLRPDIIINRFDHRTAGSTHGHHTSSAILSNEAFDMVANENIYPEQLKYVSAWQPTRLYFNTGWWFYGSQENFKKADKSNMIGLDVGVFYPVTGKSNGEIAAQSRSMHKCQGFGSSGSRGERIEYLEFLKGSKPENNIDLFEGINTTWSRVNGGKHIGELVDQLDESFNYENPASSLPVLMEIYTEIENLEEGHWKSIKLKETSDLIVACAGLYVDATSSQYFTSPGATLPIDIEVTNRSNYPIVLKNISYLPSMSDSLIDLVLKKSMEFELKEDLNIPYTIKTSSPYWLDKPHEKGVYEVDDQILRGVPETDRPLKVQFNFAINQKSFSIIRAIRYKRTDPVKGEYYRPLEIIPPVSMEFAEEVYIFPDDESQFVNVSLKTYADNIKGSIELELEEGWKSEPEFFELDVASALENLQFTFKLSPPPGQSVTTVKAVTSLGENKYEKGLKVINYDHIPVQTILKTSEAKLVKIDLRNFGKRIAYIAGAGDKIPESLRQIGCTVDLIDPADIHVDLLNKYDACITGIRAYNTQEELPFKQNELLAYVKGGGTLIIQYNTSRRLNMDNLGPYPLKLSRDRVAEEDAEIRFLIPDHPLLNYPNKISSTDFDGWVQERGLYFPGEWDEKYDALFSANDQGESPKNSPLLVTQYGKGYYIYTGFSWFRQLPAGVPGAFRLFANLVSIGKIPKP